MSGNVKTCRLERREINKKAWIEGQKFCGLLMYTDANTYFFYSMMCNEDIAQRISNRTYITELKIYRFEKDFLIEHPKA